MIKKDRSKFKRKSQEKNKIKKNTKRSDPNPYQDDFEDDLDDYFDDELYSETENMTDGEINVEDEALKTTDIVFERDLDFKLINKEFPKGPSSKNTPFILVKINERIEVIKNIVNRKYNKDFIENGYRFLSAYLSGFYDFEIEDINKFDLMSIAPSNVIFGKSKNNVNRNYLLYGFIRLWNDEHISLNFLIPSGGRLKDNEYAFMKLRLALGNNTSLKEELKKLLKNSKKPDEIRLTNSFIDFINNVNLENGKFQQIHSYKTKEFLEHLKNSKRFNKLFNRLVGVE